MRKTDLGSDDEIALGETVELFGRVAHVRKFDLLVLQEGSRTCHIYFNCASDLSPGDNVRVIATRVAGKDDKLLPLAAGYDNCGAECAWQAKLIVVESFGSASEVDFQSDQLADSDFTSGAGNVRGKVVRTKSKGIRRFLKVRDGEFEFRATFRASDSEWNSLQVERADTVKLSGFVSKLDKLGGRRFDVDVPDASHVVVLTRHPSFERKSFYVLVGTCGLIVATGGILVWRLRGKVGKTTADLANVVARLNSSYDAVREGILVTDRQGRIVASNARVAEILGIPTAVLLSQNKGRKSDAQFQRLAERFEGREAFLRALRNSQADPESSESLELQTHDANRRTIVVYTAPVKRPDAADGSPIPDTRIWTFDDISERKQLQANLIQSQKMDAIGRLAGGMAHDFNNVLLAIGVNLEMAKMSTEAGAESLQFIAEAEKASQRAAKLVEHLLGFSRKSTLKIRVGDPNRIVRRTQPLVERVMHPNISLTMDLSPDLLNARMDEAHIEQVLLNLCLNACNACTSGGGMIHISTSNVDREEVRARLQKSVEGELQAQYVVITVEDNGVGMSEEVCQNAFDPFFTTRASDMGTGLGLSMSLGIIEQHAGFIQFDSELGRGTRFEVFLPATQEPVHAVERGSQAVSETEKTSGHLLLADDDELVRSATAQALRKRGYDVATVDNGLEALDRLRSGDYDLALLDVVMPGMSGTEVTEEILSQWPQFPIILISGYADKLDESVQGYADANLTLIAKPYRLEEMCSVIEDSKRFWGQPRFPGVHG